MLMIRGPMFPATPKLAARFDARPSRSRTGALLTMELILALPLLVGLLFAIVEMGLVWEANHQVKMASVVGARIAAHPGGDLAAVENAVENTLLKAGLKAHHTVHLEGGEHAGDLVSVEVRALMSDAAPDLLAFLGFSLAHQELVARTVLLKE